jgi:hypothetical protein
MSQKGQARVQTFPRMRNVAVWREKQSPMFGQLALSQTVWRSSVRRISFVSRYAFPVGMRARRRRRVGQPLVGAEGLPLLARL